MRDLIRQYNKQLYWILPTVGLTAVWLAFSYFFQLNEIENLATAFATACVIALIQSHYKKSN